MKLRHPCKAKVKLKGKRKDRLQQGPLSMEWERTYNGETDIALRADGSFQGTMTVPDSFRMAMTVGPLSCQGTEVGGTCQTGNAVCTFTFAPAPTNVEIVGGYRESDDSLVFSQMSGMRREETGTTAQCPVPGGGRPPAAFAGGVLAGLGEVKIALEDGAEFAFPRPAGVQGEWEFKLQLEYPGRVGATSETPPRTDVATHKDGWAGCRGGRQVIFVFAREILVERVRVEVARS
jgi:hypothetical protein